VRWRLFYDSGLTFGSSQGTPHESPGWGVVAIAQDTGQRYEQVLASGVPWYVYRTDWGHWQELDDTGYLDTMVHHAQDVSAVRPGRYMARDAFQAIWAEARTLAAEWAHG